MVTSNPACQPSAAVEPPKADASLCLVRLCILLGFLQISSCLAFGIQQPTLLGRHHHLNEAGTTQFCWEFGAATAGYLDKQQRAFTSTSAVGTALPNAPTLSHHGPPYPYRASRRWKLVPIIRPKNVPPGLEVLLAILLGSNFPAMQRLGSTQNPSNLSLYDYDYVYAAYPPPPSPLKLSTAIFTYKFSFTSLMLSTT